MQQALQQRHYASNFTTEDNAASELHRDYMASFYHRFRPASHFVSHLTCFSCLREPPEYPLPCGHVLCRPCVQSFGKPRGRGLIQLRDCPFHDAETRWQDPYLVTIKPPLAGTRVLALDGSVYSLIWEMVANLTIEVEFVGSRSLKFSDQ